MPKRGAFALVMTALAVVLLLGFRTPEDIAAITGGDMRAGVTGAVGTTGATGTNRGTTGTTGGTGGGTTGGGTTGGGTTGGGTTGGGPTGGGTTGGASGPTAQATARTVTGPVVSTQFGTVQVAVTVEGGQLTDVTALQLPSGDRRSASISSRVELTLRSQALRAQSAAIDGVSGATYTSTAYARSLQAALDSAGM